jgi:hypothetical protein
MFSDAFIKKGDLLFRNLTYFRQHEGNKRGDPLEGFHRDNPDNDVILSDPKTGKVLAKGDFSFLNSTNTDLINVFCLSTRYGADLYKEFECDCCIEIMDSKEFIRRAYIAVKSLVSSHKSGLLYRDVTYYKDNAPAGFDVKQPKNLAFAKGVHYKHQDEFRLAFGTRKAFSLKQQIIINTGYDFMEGAQKGTPKEKHLLIGNLDGIVKVHYSNRVAGGF